MERGEMRVEVNISVSKDAKLGTKVEVKNINSFRSVAGAIEFEIKRHVEALDRGEKIIQETRGWDEAKGVTFSQRLKESSHDYRYFPDPDLPKLRLSLVSELSKDAIIASLPELPHQKRARLKNLGYLQPQDIEQLMNDTELAALFGQVGDTLQDPALIKIAANFILNDIAGERKKSPAWPLPTVSHLAEVVRQYHAGKLASPQAKTSILSGSLVEMADTASLKVLIDEVIAANPTAVGEVKNGKQSAINFLVGQGMRASKGSANPQELEKLIRETLGT
jgi:aspartyl-tRNA(Asn)/glutamyl-tRNA(Gln) amidotransferase subunit B